MAKFIINPMPDSILLSKLKKLINLRYPASPKHCIFPITNNILNELRRLFA
jgi:hypothetical protein